jgi:hypothetical protein
MNAFPDTSADIKSALRQELLRLARFEENRASAEAATVPYWSPCPPSVEGHRMAAAVLRADADAFLGVA